MPLGCHLNGWMACNCLNMWFSYILTCSPSPISGPFFYVLVTQNCSVISLERFHCFKTSLSCLGISAWHVCSGNVLFINTLTFGCIYISPMLLWCIISDIRCSGGCGKLGNNMGWPSPPPLSSDQASGFLPSIYKGTLFSPSFQSVKWLVSSVLDATGYLFRPWRVPLLLFLPNSPLISSF